MDVAPAESLVTSQASGTQSKESAALPCTGAGPRESTSTNFSPGASAFATLLRHLPKEPHVHPSTPTRAAPRAPYFGTVGAGTEAKKGKEGSGSGTEGFCSLFEVEEPRENEGAKSLSSEVNRERTRPASGELPQPSSASAKNKPFVSSEDCHKSMESACKQLAFASEPQLVLKRKLIDLSPMDFEGPLAQRPRAMPTLCDPQGCDGVVPSADFHSTDSLERMTPAAGHEQGCCSPEARVAFRKVTACPDAPMKLASKRPRARLGLISRKLFAEPELVSA